MLFANRDAAARLLAGKLAAHRGQDPLVLAIPRGAVPMGRIVADALDGELDVALVRKIGAPGNPQYAIGSVAEGGEIAVREDARALGIPQSWIDAEARRQIATLHERRRLYTPGRPPADPAGRVAIVLDDGVATGSTMLAALEVVRGKRPAKLVAATAVAPPSTVRRLAREADEVVVLATPEPFYAVGRFFDDFGEVTDAEVVAALAAAGDRVPTPH
jgi:predicted phosphoribosyltransferase